MVKKSDDTEKQRWFKVGFQMRPFTVKRLRMAAADETRMIRDILEDALTAYFKAKGGS